MWLSVAGQTLLDRVIRQLPKPKPLFIRAVSRRHEGKHGRAGFGSNMHSTGSTGKNLSLWIWRGTLPAASTVRWSAASSSIRHEPKKAHSARLIVVNPKPECSDQNCASISTIQASSDTPDPARISRIRFIGGFATSQRSGEFSERSMKTPASSTRKRSWISCDGRKSISEPSIATGAILLQDPNLDLAAHADDRCGLCDNPGTRGTTISRMSHADLARQVKAVVREVDSLVALHGWKL